MEKLLVLCSLLAFATAFGLWLVKPRTAESKNIEQLAAALLRLLKRPYGAYVIVEEPAFGKFVQFSGSIREPLVFDLPRQSLTLTEYERACALFAELGYAAPETFAVFDSSGGSPVGTQTSFIRSFGADVDGAARLAMQVFSSVYGLAATTRLKILER